ncbi:MAG: helix-turn-helix transcriptional regulator [Blastochloris sp.]|nr:helix-turn-helix transcriptional regulator [Blastochloris sp.]
MSRVFSGAFEARLDYERKQGRRITMAEVARATGISRTTLRRLEKNETDGIDFETIRKLCDFYGVTPEAIIKYEQHKHETPDEQRVPRLALAI